MRDPSPTACVRATLSDFVGQEDLLGEGGSLSSILSASPASLVDLLGTAGLREDDARPDPRGGNGRSSSSVSAVLSGIKEIREALADLSRTRAGAGPAAPVLRSSSSTRSTGATRRSRTCCCRRRGRDRHPDRDDHREPVLRDPERAPFPQPRAASFSAAPSDLETILRRALTDADRGLGNRTVPCPGGAAAIVAVADGDARVALNALEAAVAIAEHSGFPKSTWGRRRRRSGRRRSCTTRTGRSITT